MSVFVWPSLTLEAQTMIIHNHNLIPSKATIDSPLPRDSHNRQGEEHEVWASLPNQSPRPKTLFQTLGKIV